MFRPNGPTTSHLEDLGRPGLPDVSTYHRPIISRSVSFSSQYFTLFSPFFFLWKRALRSLHTPSCMLRF